jgi:hypothetical protein
MHNLIKLIRYISVTLISQAVIIACTHVPPEPVVKVHLLKATASVKQIDLSSRTVVILAANGLESSS